MSPDQKAQEHKSTHISGFTAGLAHSLLPSIEQELKLCVEMTKRFKRRQLAGTRQRRLPSTTLLSCTTESHCGEAANLDSLHCLEDRK